MTVFWVDIPKSQPRSVDMQITSSHGCCCSTSTGVITAVISRHVVPARNSTNTVGWSGDLNLGVWPELQFYRIQPFVISGVWLPRAVAQVLLFSHVHRVVAGTSRHGAVSDRGSNELAARSKTHSSCKVAPLDFWLLAPPILYGETLVWVGDGAIYTLPRNRITDVGRAVGDWRV